MAIVTDMDASQSSEPDPSKAQSKPDDASGELNARVDAPSKSEEFSAGFVFEEATGDQITQHFRNTAEMCAAPVSVHDYLHIQAELNSTFPCMRKFWVLRAPNDKNNIVCSCTTYVREAIMCEGQGGVQYTNAVIIADIFTHSDHRQKGLAKRLITDLTMVLDGETFGDTMFSIVYVDHLPKICKQLGWESLPGRILRIMRKDWEKREMKRPVIDGVKPLDAATVLDGNYDEWNIASLRMSGHRDGNTHVQISPTMVGTNWHFMRSLVWSQYSHQDDKRHQKTWGALLDKGRSCRGWVWWVHDYTSKKLMVGRLQLARLSGFEKYIALLLEAALVEASICGMKEVVLMDPSDQVVAAAEMLKRASTEREIEVINCYRTEMIPCLRWKDGLPPKNGKVILEEMQYYG